MTSLCPGCGREAEWRPGGQFVADLTHRVWHVACVREVLQSVPFDGRGLCPGCANEAEWRPGGQFVADLTHRVWHVACVREVLQHISDARRFDCAQCGADQLARQVEPGVDRPWACAQCGTVVSPRPSSAHLEEHDGRTRLA